MRILRELKQELLTIATLPNRVPDGLEPILPVAETESFEIEQKMHELVADGEMSKDDEETRAKAAKLLGLAKSDVGELAKENLFKEFHPIQKRIENACVLTDQDLDQIEALKLKYGIAQFTTEGPVTLLRQIDLLENKGQLPPPLGVDLLLDRNEDAKNGRFHVTITGDMQGKRFVV